MNNDMITQGEQHPIQFPVQSPDSIWLPFSFKKGETDCTFRFPSYIIAQLMYLLIEALNILMLCWLTFRSYEKGAALTVSSIIN
jgi:hypothetical protein